MTYDDIEHRPLAAGWSISGPTALADVVVVADKDEPGRKHAAAVTANLDGHRAGHADDAVQSPATKKEESSRPIPDRAMFPGVPPYGGADPGRMAGERLRPPYQGRRVGLTPQLSRPLGGGRCSAPRVLAGSSR